MKIHDEGDGLQPAELSGTYTTDAPNNTLTLGVDGQGDTEFILPSVSEWIMVEVYEVEGVAGDIGLTAYNSDVSNIVVDLEALRQEAITYYTTFRFVATHYKTGDLCDIYYGTEDTACTLRTTDVDFIPPVVSWKLTDTITAPWSFIEIVTGYLDYNDTNIAVEFPTLTNMTSTSNILTATADDGEATSLLIEQGVYGDITSITDLEGSFELANISESETASVKNKVFTSSTTSGGDTISVSGGSYFGSVWDVWDNNLTSDMGLQTTYPFIWAYEFGINTIITAWEMFTRYASRSPEDFTIQGSLDNIVWDTLLTVTGLVLVDDDNPTFNFVNTTAYKHYRLHVTLAGSDRCQIYEHILHSPGDLNLLKTSSPIADGDNLIIVKDNDSVNEVVASGVTTIPGPSLGDITEVMTSNTQNGHTTVASSILSAANEPFKCFDNDLNSFWHSAVDGGLGWVTYEFPAPEILTSYKIAPRNTGGNNGSAYITTWAFEGWNGTGWDVLHLQDSLGYYTAGFLYEFALPGTTPYAKYRLRAITTNGTYSSFAEMELITLGPPTYEMDTTSTTSGEVPTRVYANPKVTLITDGGDHQLVPETLTPTIGPPFTTVQTYNDVTGISSRDLQTNIKMFTDDKMFYLQGTYSEEDIGILDESITYDETNIATEFIA